MISVLRRLLTIDQIEEENPHGFGYLDSNDDDYWYALVRID